jgi:two-component system, OmpR family, phosphate regulon sensor histidine kinase PhoR
MESALIRSIVEAMPQPAFIVTKAARITVANRAARDLLGLALEGRHFGLSLRQPSVVAVIDAALTNGEVGQGRFTITGPSSETIYRLTATPVSGEGHTGALCVFEDISDAEQMGQMRREFVANVSHELRTPLTALLGFIETLQGAARDDATARARFLGIMEREAGRMNRLVSDLLHLSQVEAAERLRPSEAVDIVGTVMTTTATLRSMADAAGVKIEVSGPAGPIMLPGDADQLVQVFQNLIENAVKYGGGGGGVTITLRRETEPAMGGPVVVIAVRDQGEGFDPLHIPRLTERFYRVDSHRSREKGGTGLGLAIVKHIVNRHRGRLRIDTELGKGSTFTVILPES